MKNVRRTGIALFERGEAHDGPAPRFVHLRSISSAAGTVSRAVHALVLLGRVVLVADGLDVAAPADESLFGCRTVGGQHLGRVEEFLCGCHRDHFPSLS